MVSPTSAGVLAEKILSPSINKENRKLQLEAATLGLSDKDKKYFMDAYDAASGAKGKKLDPFGLATAGAASQMQQMGGGDIFGAVGFTPLERIATATEETAKNTAPQNEANQQAQRPTDNLAR